VSEQLTSESSRPSSVVPVPAQDPSANQRHWNFWKEKLGVPYFSNATENIVLATRDRFDESPFRQKSSRRHFQPKIVRNISSKY
jgi:hypothetical protein